MYYTPGSELGNRIARLQQHLCEMGLDGALLHGITNLYYFSGTAQQSHLWVPAQGTPVLMVRRILQRAQQESALERIEPISSLKQLPDFLGTVRRIGLELDIMPVSLFTGYQKALPDVTFTDIGPVTRLIRSVKSPYEVDQVRGAARIADAVLQDAFQALTEGMTELDLSIVAESSARRNGFPGMVRWRAATGFELSWLHVLAGESGVTPSFGDTTFGGEGLTPAVPYGAGLRRIGRNMPVVIDMPTGYNGYIHDSTRTLSIGPLDEELVRAHTVSREICAMFQQDARPGVLGEDLWHKAAAMAEKAGLQEHFMGWGSARVRFVAHGVGLELDELPIAAPKQQQPLAAGNVIAVEPKFFFPGKGAVGIENTYVVTAKGMECLTLTTEEIMVK